MMTKGSSSIITYHCFQFDPHPLFFIDTQTGYYATSFFISRHLDPKGNFPTIFWVNFRGFCRIILQTVVDYFYILCSSSSLVFYGLSESSSSLQCVILLIFSSFFVLLILYCRTLCKSRANLDHSHHSITTCHKHYEMRTQLHTLPKLTFLFHFSRVKKIHSDFTTL